MAVYHQNVFGCRRSCVYRGMSVLYTNQITSGSEDLNSVHRQSCHLPNKLLLNYDQPQSVKETLNNKAVSSHFSGFSLPPGCLCNALPWLAVPASWGLEALIYTAEMETGFCAKHQGPPVTYLSVAFATYQEVLCLLSYPLPYHHTWFYEILFPFVTLFSMCPTNIPFYL